MTDHKPNNRHTWDGTPGLASPMQIISGTASQLFTVGNETSSLHPMGKVKISIVDLKPIQQRPKASVKVTPARKKSKKSVR